MFSKKTHNAKFLEASSETFGTIIGNDTEFHGTLLLSEGVRIDGKIVGNIEVRSNARVTIAIGKTGQVEGDICAFRVLVAGTIRGNVYASERVELHDTANVHGDITYDSIGIEPGASLNGHMISKVGESESEHSPDSATQLQSALDKIKEDSGIKT